MFQLNIKKKWDLARRLKVIQEGNFHAFMNIAGNLVIDDVTGNILQQRAVDGSRLKENEPKTKEYKLKYLGHSKSLIWFRILIDKSTYILKSGPSKVQIFLKPIRDEIGKFLEAKGYHFWGISPWIKEVILKKWRDYIKGGFK